MYKNQSREINEQKMVTYKKRTVRVLLKAKVKRLWHG